ncbi:flavodoxin family protein [Vibrio mexicanus]|uniref:flavodoxin family protein n=1 Tax=Vibrio mexicanus TaxID=1004326 RepID=UPI00063C72A1|nr:flavodoxin family protein [Vibrio mexicanus]
MATKIAIVYFSHGGNTKQIATKVAEGVEQCDVQPTLFEIVGDDIQAGRYSKTEVFHELSEYDAILFGSPTYMGSAAAQFKAFMDASSDSYCKGIWRDKIAAGFTSGGSINGEQQQTLLSFFVLANQHGMLWAGLDTSVHVDELGLNRTGSSIGLVSSHDENGQLHPNDLETAHHFGKRIALLVK